MKETRYVLSENNKTCDDCFHFELCIGFQALEDTIKKQPKTTKEDFLAMEKHKECKHFDRG